MTTKSDRNMSHVEAVAAGLVTKNPISTTVYLSNRDWPDSTQFPGAKPLPVPNSPQVIITENLQKQLDAMHNKPKASDRQVAGTHYKDMGIQVWDVVDTWPLEQQIGYYRGGALKYLMRMGSKDQSAQEVAKGQHYMEKLLELLQSDVYKAS